MSTIRTAVPIMLAFSALTFNPAATRDANAVAMWTSTVTAEIDPLSVTLTGGNSYVFVAETTSVFPGPTTTGTGDISTLVGVNDLGFGTQTSSTAGSASHPPSSSAIARMETHDLILVDNFLNLTPAVLEFTMTFSASSSVSTTEPNEAASSNYNIHITGIGDEAGESAEFSLDGGPFMSVLRLKDALTFPAVTGDEFQLDVGQSAFGPGGADSSSDSGTLLVRYTIAADNDNAFSIFTRAGNAALAVPEPTTALLMLVGLGGALARRRRLR